MAPPSSGGSTEGEILNILNGYPLASEPRVEALFHYLEASRLAYADRNAYVGDPDYVSVPLAGLLDPACAATRRCLIGDTALTSPVAPGSPFGPFPGCGNSAASTQISSASPEAHHTNNIVTEDKWGDIVAYTNTINFFGGSGQVVPGYGLLLNDEMTDFDFAPSWPGAYEPNLPAAGKEPRSSMGPVIALRDGTPQFAIGAAGGSTIITTVVQILVRREVRARHRADPSARQLPAGCDGAADARARSGRGDRRAGPPGGRQCAGGTPEFALTAPVVKIGFVLRARFVLASWPTGGCRG
jgi:gamma-glutamyltranspeptidase/glutathione hydrolase